MFAFIVKTSSKRMMLKLKNTSNRLYIYRHNLKEGTWNR